MVVGTLKHPEGVQFFKILQKNLYREQILH